MKSLKKTLVLLVVLSMILSAVSPVFAFNDVIAEEYAEQANKMAAFGVFEGDKVTGNFDAEKEITRAEMAVIIGKLMGLTANEANANMNYATNFSDVAAGEWYTGWVNLVAGRGIISGFPDGTFRPNEKVTQAQAVTMIVKALGWGVVVDQTGTWPANYITKASELRLFKNAVETNSELVTRGNVAIYCYNALTARTWDVTESTDGKLTSSSKETTTILEKYFSDFTNEDGEMKLVEEAKVEVCGATTNAIGANQVQLSVAVALVSGERTGLSLADYIEAERAPKKGETEVTYAITSGTDAGEVVAYIPEGVANVASLAGKTVNVIFGKDNEVAYIEVVDDAVESTYVTAYDDVKREITIDGEKIELADTVAVSVFGHNIGNDVKDSTQTIKTLFAALTGASTKRTMARNIFADYTLDAKDEIATINFTFAAGYNANNILVEEFIVEKRIGDKLTVAGTSTKIDLELYEDAEPRVIKNGEVATLEDIVAGDVLTRVSYNSNVETIYVTSNTIEGAIEDYDTVTVIVDGTEYVTSLNTSKVFVKEETDAEKYSSKTLAQIYTAFDDVEVTAYLNMAGEIVAVVGEAETTGYVLGLVTVDATKERDRNAKINYLDVEILTEDGEKGYYSIYNKESDESMTDDDKNNYKAGTVVVFLADADNIIKSDKIQVIGETTSTSVYSFASNDKVQAIRVAAADVASKLTVNKANKTITVADDANPHESANKTYYYKSTTTLVDAKEQEIMSKWASITNSDAFATVESGSYVYLFVKGTKLVYVVAEVSSRGTTELQYGMVASKVYRGEEDDEFLVDVLVDGTVETYECAELDKTKLNGAYDKNATIGGLISFNLSDGKLQNITNMFSLDYIDYLDNKTEDDYVVASTGFDADVTTFTGASHLGVTAGSTKFEAIKVTEVEPDEDVVYVTLNDTKIIELAEEYVAYRLATNEVVEEVSEGDFIIYFDNDEGYNLVIILN